MKPMAFTDMIATLSFLQCGHIWIKSKKDRILSPSRRHGNLWPVHWAPMSGEMDQTLGSSVYQTSYGWCDGFPYVKLVSERSWLLQDHQCFKQESKFYTSSLKRSGEF